MDSHIKKVYIPMTETSFYILMCLREEAHGYSYFRKPACEMNGNEEIFVTMNQNSR